MKSLRLLPNQIRPNPKFSEANRYFPRQIRPNPKFLDAYSTTHEVALSPFEANTTSPDIFRSFPNHIDPSQSLKLTVFFIFVGENAVENDSANSPPPFSPTGTAPELAQQLSPQNTIHLQPPPQQPAQPLSPAVTPHSPNTQPCSNNNNNMEMDVPMGIPPMISPNAPNYDVRSPPTQTATQNGNGGGGNYYTGNSKESNVRQQQQQHQHMLTKDPNQNFVDQNGVEMYATRNGHGQHNVDGYQMNYTNGVHADPMMNAAVLAAAAQQQTTPQAYRKFMRSIHDHQMLQNGDPFKMELKDEPENGF